jgi:speckle-type POZ protein
MSVSASSVGRSGGTPQASSSSITAAAATGTHQLKIDSYSLTKSLPCGAHIKSSNFQAAGYSWYINYFPNGCGRLIKRARDYLSLQLVLDDAVAATAGAVMAQFTLSVINSAGLLERTTARKSPVHNLARGGAAGWWFFKYMSKADLKSKFLDLKDDSFTLQCDVVIIDRFRAVKAAPFVDVPPPDLHRHLSCSSAGRPPTSRCRPAGRRSVLTGACSLRGRRSSKRSSSAP